MKNNKIALYIFLRDITVDGGGERIVFNMANEFIKRYQHVTLISKYKTNDHFHYQLNDKVEVKFISPDKPNRIAPNKSALGDFIYELKFQHAITKPIKNIIKKCTPKDYTAVVLFVGYETALCKPKNTFYIGVDECSAIILKPQTLKHKLFNSCKRLSQKQLDIAGVLSDQELGNWTELHKPVRILTNFITDIPTEVAPQSQREKTIIAAGRMFDGQKGFDRLIEYYAKIANKYPDWKLKIFGQGALKTEFQTIIDRLNVGQYVELHPFSKDIFSEYGKASIFAMSSRWEGFGLVTTEAMACGAVPVAVAARRPSGTSFILKDMPECLSAENDMEGFTANLERFMQDENLRQRTANKGRDVVYKRFSPEALMTVWSDLFDELTLRK